MIDRHYLVFLGDLSCFTSHVVVRLFYLVDCFLSFLVSISLDSSFLSLLLSTPYPSSIHLYLRPLTSNL